jgi:hypothetical protein
MEEAKKKAQVERDNVLIMEVSAETALCLPLSRPRKNGGPGKGSKDEREQITRESPAGFLQLRLRSQGGDSRKGGTMQSRLHPVLGIAIIRPIRNSSCRAPPD